MAVMDEFKAQREAMKEKSFKEKAQYFWDYYKVHTVVAVLLLVFVIAFIHSILTHKDTVFTAAFINGYFDGDTEAFMDSFSDYIGIDTAQYDTYLDASFQINSMMDTLTLASIQKFSAMIYSQQGDAVICDSDVFAHYGYNNIFGDIREFLTEEQITLYEKDFFYIDMTPGKESHYFDFMEEPASDNVAQEAVAETTDYRNPAGMENPVPIGIYLTDIPNLEAQGYSCNGTPVFGIPTSTLHADYSLAFLEYITGAATK